MNGKTIGIAVAALVIGLVGGFLLANGLNRSEMNALKTQAQSGAANTGAPKRPDDMTLDPAEIKAKIAEADSAPQNFDFQKNLGSSLYRYSTMKKDTEFLNESVRILKRANQLNPQDYLVLTDLANALFDVSMFARQPDKMVEARTYYEKALAQKPDDADIRTEYALSFFAVEPPELDRAISEFERALKVDPKQERALQFLAQSYIRKGDFDTAAKTVDKLKAINPSNDSLPLLSSQIEKREAAPTQ